MISSVKPGWMARPYTFAVSKKFRPCSRARSMTAKLSLSLVCGPKFMVPRQRRLTFRPVRPRCAYCISVLVRVTDGVVDRLLAPGEPEHAAPAALGRQVRGGERGGGRRVGTCPA